MGKGRVCKIGKLRFAQKRGGGSYFSKPPLEIVMINP